MVTVLPYNDVNIELAAAELRTVYVIGMPPETVYGHAAGAWKANAVAEISPLKRAPPTLHSSFIWQRRGIRDMGKRLERHRTNILA